MEAKIRININSQEFEIQGTEKFVGSYSATIEQFISLLSPSKSPLSTGVTLPSIESPKTIGTSYRLEDSLPETFGEYFYLLRDDANENDKLLAAGRFAQSTSEDNSFGTGTGSHLLLDQGVKLANPSTSIKRLVKQRYVIMLSKGKYRVSPDGLNRLKEIFTKEEN
jgi:hypothetical protein